MFVVFLYTLMKLPRNEQLTKEIVEEKMEYLLILDLGKEQ